MRLAVNLKYAPVTKLSVSHWDSDKQKTALWRVSTYVKIPYYTNDLYFHPGLGDWDRQQL